MKKILAVLLLLMVAVFPAAADAENMIQNPDFNSQDALSMPDDWYRDMWYTDAGVSYLTISNESADGCCIMVENVTENDARFCQDIAVEPDTLYEIRCIAKAEGISEGSIGANISVKDTFSYSAYLFDTAGEWQELVMYGRTGDKQTSLTLCARVGGYSGLNTGKAWFDSFEMRPVDSLPEGFAALDFEPMTASSNNTIDAAEDAVPVRYTEAWLLAAFGMALGFIALWRKKHKFASGWRRNDVIFVFILAFALIARLVVSVMVRGYNTDINCFSLWSERMFAKGPAAFYSADYFCDYPPLYMLMLWLVGALRQLFGLPFQSTGHILLIKLIPILFDIALAALIYLAARRRGSMSMALVLGAVCALNPAAIVDSAAWGQIDSVFTMFTLLGAMLLVNGCCAGALPAIVLAILTKPQALLFAPLGLFVIIVEFIRSKDTKKALTDLLIGLGISLAMLLVAALIFRSPEKGPVEWLVSLYSGTMNGYPHITVNAFNLYQLFGLNWVKMDSLPVMSLISWLMFASAYLYSGFVYITAKRRSALYLAAAALIMLICATGPMIHERYVYPALALLTMALIVEKDFRLFISLAVLSVSLFMNQVLVLQGGMTEANYGHLQSSENWLNCLMSLITVLNAAFTAYTAFDIAVVKRTLTGPDRRLRPEPPIQPANYRLNLKRADYIIMAAVTLIYSVAAFTNLGVTDAPQTSFTTSMPGEAVTFDLGQERTYQMEYYGGICDTDFVVEFSNDGIEWTQPVYAIYDQGEIFRWLIFTPAYEDHDLIYNGETNSGGGTTVNYPTYDEKYPFQTSRYVRISAVSAGLILSEVGFIDENGAAYPVEIVEHTGAAEDHASDPALLIDEQETVPAYPTYLNSSYFDEIYHARTAYEHQNALRTYEWTHPPLGKVLMMFGIEIFGMTPFGWRFMGALAGVLMLPIMYLMAKQLGASTKVSALAMLMLALDSMHFTQTRIATIDSYAVLWIMLMYLFMFRYVKMSFNREPLWKTLIPLSLCGITMGLAWATKWIGIYASAGLAVLFFWSFIKRFTEYRSSLNGVVGPDRQLIHINYWIKALVTTLVCLVCFIAIPLLIYYFSYYWHMQYVGGLDLDKVISLQQSIFNYHAGLGGDTHYFRSPWYEWPVIAWPMWYYSGTAFLEDGMISSISCMGNPAVWWTGLAAIVAVAIRAAWNRRADKTELIILIGFLSQYLPWVLVPRSTFIYHYFASVPFIILAAAVLLGRFEKRKPVLFHTFSGVLLGLALVLFVMFYPLESGLPMSAEYAKYLRWFNWYNY